MSFFARIFAKMITDFSGCLHLRHPYEMGGAAFCISMVWAQIFPFVALQFYVGGEDVNDDVKDTIGLFLIGSLIAYILLNVAFFGTIDLKFGHTFFGTSERASDR